MVENGLACERNLPTISRWPKKPEYLISRVRGGPTFARSNANRAAQHALWLRELRSPPYMAQGPAP